MYNRHGPVMSHSNSTYLLNASQTADRPIYKGTFMKARSRDPATSAQPWIMFRALGYLKRKVEEQEVAMWKRNMRYCGADVQISERCSIWGWEGFSIGDGSVINQFTHIFASGGVEIGRDVMISSNCSISSVTHPVQALHRSAEPMVLKPVKIGNNVWIGMGAVILPGITIGDHAVVGAGSVVTHDVPCGVVVAGNPAKVLRCLDLNLLSDD